MEQEARRRLIVEWSDGVVRAQLPVLLTPAQAAGAAELLRTAAEQTKIRPRVA